MKPDISRVDLVLHYSLLEAGEEDGFAERQLGPIHLIKYVYLADLLHSQRKGGETYTGIDWQFNKFGPWSQKVNERIEPALTAINAKEGRYDSQFADDGEFVRWSLRDGRLLEKKREELPLVIAGQLKKLIHKFGKDTPALLEHVYRTSPMLKAAPYEALDFTPDEDLQISEAPTETVSFMDSLTPKKRKIFNQKKKLLRERLGKNRRSSQLMNPAPAPRYDEVYEAGMEYLDSLAGEKFSEFKGIAKFDNSVWKSKARNPDELP